MKSALGLLSTAAVFAFIAGAPAFAQATSPGAPAGNAPVTAEEYGYGYGQPGPFAPVGAFASGFGALGAGVVAAPGAVMGGPAYAMQPRGCGVIHDFNGRYTAVCGL
jgi:hypothetical protein